MIGRPSSCPTASEKTMPEWAVIVWYG